MKALPKIKDILKMKDVQKIFFIGTVVMTIAVALKYILEL
jgi:hypothetical protein